MRQWVHGFRCLVYFRHINTDKCIPILRPILSVTFFLQRLIEFRSHRRDHCTARILYYVRTTAKWGSLVRKRTRLPLWEPSSKGPGNQQAVVVCRLEIQYICNFDLDFEFIQINKNSTQYLTFRFWQHIKNTHINHSTHYDWKKKHPKFENTEHKSCLGHFKTM